MRLVSLDDAIVYDGLQLSTGFVDLHAGEPGDVLLTFVGAADVPTENLVDLEDAEAGATIRSAEMAHVVAEHRDLPLAEGVLRQRLMVRLAAQWIVGRSGTAVDVRGDDLFVADAKLSVSVATNSPRGCLLHLGVNVDATGAPVRAAGLRDLRIPPREFLGGLARLYAEELISVSRAVSKVRPTS